MQSLSSDAIFLVVVPGNMTPPHHPLHPDFSIRKLTPEKFIFRLFEGPVSWEENPASWKEIYSRKDRDVIEERLQTLRFSIYRVLK